MPHVSHSLPLFTDIPRYGADDDTEQVWQWFHAVCQLVATELAAQRPGTLALVDDGDEVYWLTEQDGFRHLACAPTHDGEVVIAAAARVADLAGFGVDELNHKRETLTRWLMNQATMRVGDARLLRLPPVQRNDD
ncbi:hypothetical protein GCM10007350_37080 [Jeongeupia chitinilytica]|uniref:Uncharacterized protein n=1 Tax=Jeongeupia chitinilytica TaxID=1041641 RepID=A0ABQ3H6D8_9NEIS|nr:hypothetical protein GCM10007350_37080 [Jeongeupia chitinilytica]